MDRIKGGGGGHCRKIRCDCTIVPCNDRIVIIISNAISVCGIILMGI